MSVAEAQEGWSVRFALRGRRATIHIGLPSVDLQDLARLAWYLRGFHSGLYKSVSQVTQWVRCQQNSRHLPTAVLRAVRHTPEGCGYSVG